MTNKELFKKTVNILVDAYRNDTLRHSSCCACAVGNIVASACSYTYKNVGEYGLMYADNYASWMHVFVTIRGEVQYIDPNSYEGEAKKQIDSTGYPWEDLAKIEYAFEMAPQGQSDDDWMLNGLLAVYDVLCEIHEVEANEVPIGREVFAHV